MLRLQMDLIGIHTRSGKYFRWILNCRDHYSKYSWVFVLKFKETKFKADKLITLFYQFGSCKILQSDNWKKFTATVVRNLKVLCPGLITINGKPCHPQSQGLIKRVHATLYSILGKYMTDRQTIS